MAQGGQFTTPAEAAFVKIWIVGRLTHGWLDFSDVSLQEQTQIESTVVRSTYSIAGQSIAVRVTSDPQADDDGLYYLFNDHLGSMSAMGDSNGALVAGSVNRFLPFGDWRTEPSSNPSLTDMGYTGHKHNNSGTNDIGLIYMNARYYVSGIGRFASADTIVPDQTNPQNYNRYSYVLNQPTIGVDPDGHCYPVCTAVLGGLIGGIAGGVTYYATTPAAERNFSDASLAVGVGAVGGALIGTGVGIAAAGTVTTVAAASSTATASTMLISAGTGTVVAAETNMIMNGITGSSFDRTDFALGSATATLEGAAAPGLGPVRSVVSSGAFGAGESLLSDALHGQSLSFGDALSSGLWGLGSGIVGSSVEGLATGFKNVGSSSSDSISKGVQTLDFSFSTNNDFILNSWQNSTAKQSGSSALRTFFRDTLWGVSTGVAEEEN